MDQGAITLTTLCGPSGSLQQFSSIFQMLISTFSPGRARREWESRQAAETFNVISIKRRCEKQKIDLLSILPNDHQYIRSQDSTQSLVVATKRPRAPPILAGIIWVYIATLMIIATSAQPVEGEFDSQNSKSYSY